MLYLNYLSNIDNTPKGAQKYLVVRIPPKHFNPYQHPDIHHKPQLSPSRELLLASKNGDIPFEEFKNRFLKEINTRHDLKQAIRELVDTLQSGKSVCLVCYEEQSEDCHRKLIADYLKKEYGIDYVDIKKTQDAYKQLSLWDI